MGTAGAPAPEACGLLGLKQGDWVFVARLRAVRGLDGRWDRAYLVLVNPDGRAVRSLARLASRGQLAADLKRARVFEEYVVEPGRVLVPVEGEADAAEKLTAIARAIGPGAAAGIVFEGGRPVAVYAAAEDDVIHCISNEWAKSAAEAQRIMLEELAENIARALGVERDTLRVEPPRVAGPVRVIVDGRELGDDVCWKRSS